MNRCYFPLPLVAMVLLGGLAAQGPAKKALPMVFEPVAAEPKMVIERDGREVVFAVQDEAPEFLGAILVATDPTMRHYLHLLPPLLANGEVLVAGVATDWLKFRLDLMQIPTGVMFYLQGVTYTEAFGVRASLVREFVLDGEG